MNDPLLNPNAPLLRKKEREVQDDALVVSNSDAVVLITTQDSVRLKPKSPELKEAKQDKVVLLVGCLYPLVGVICASFIATCLYPT